jgi:ankyrin repeat protein
VTDPTAYSYKPILWAAEQGITSGVDATHFGGDISLSYDQILTFLCRAAGGTITDDWSQSAQNWAKANGLTDGISFAAKAGCPRADVVYFLWKQMK